MIRKSSSSPVWNPAEMAWRSNTPAEWSDLCSQKVRSDMRFFLQKMASGSEGLVDGLESYFIVKIILWSHLEIRSGCMDDCIDSGEIRLQKWLWGMYKKKGLFLQRVYQDQISLQRWCPDLISLQSGYWDQIAICRDGIEIRYACRDGVEVR